MTNGQNSSFLNSTCGIVSVGGGHGGSASFLNGTDGVRVAVVEAGRWNKLCGISNKTTIDNCGNSYGTYGGNGASGGGANSLAVVVVVQIHRV